MKEQLISLETAKLATEKGFEISGNQAGFTMNKPSCLNLPTQSLLQKWLRDDKEIVISIIHDLYSPKFYYRITSNNNGTKSSKFYGTRGFDTYEESLEDAIFESLNLIP